MELLLLLIGYLVFAWAMGRIINYFLEKWLGDDIPALKYSLKADEPQANRNAKSPRGSEKAVTRLTTRETAGSLGDSNRSNNNVVKLRS